MDCKFEVGCLYEFIPEKEKLMHFSKYQSGVVKVVEVTPPTERYHSYQIKCEIVSGCTGLHNPHTFDEKSRVGLCMHYICETKTDDQLEISFEAMIGGTE